LISPKSIKIVAELAIVTKEKIQRRGWAGREESGRGKAEKSGREGSERNFFEVSLTGMAEADPDFRRFIRIQSYDQGGDGDPPGFFSGEVMTANGISPGAVFVIPGKIHEPVR
jgi:hypothetical protein